jgi:hypothetical protein
MHAACKDGENLYCCASTLSSGSPGRRPAGCRPCSHERSRSCPLATVAPSFWPSPWVRRWDSSPPPHHPRPHPSQGRIPDPGTRLFPPPATCSPPCGGGSRNSCRPAKGRSGRRAPADARSSRQISAVGQTRTGVPIAHPLLHPTLAAGWTPTDIPTAPRLRRRTSGAESTRTESPIAPAARGAIRDCGCALERRQPEQPTAIEAQCALSPAATLAAGRRRHVRGLMERNPRPLM